MLKTFLSRWLDRFEKTFSYDASYMRHVLRVNPWSLLKFSLGTQACDRAAAPPELLIAAGHHVPVPDLFTCFSINHNSLLLPQAAASGAASSVGRNLARCV